MFLYKILFTFIFNIFGMSSDKEKHFQRNPTKFTRSIQRKDTISSVLSSLNTSEIKHESIEKN